MKRLYIAAVAGLWSVVPLQAQEGQLAPTAPVVPAPVLQNGSLIAPAGGSGSWGTSGSRLFSRNTWSPIRSPVVASEPGYLAPPTGAPALGYAMPPLTTGAGGPTGKCAPDGKCAPGGKCGHERGGMNWDRLKAWLCYHPSKTELPKCQPTPYIQPIQGLFACTSVHGCTTGCANGNCAHPHQPAAYPQQPSGHPLPLPHPQPQSQPMTPPIPPAAGAGAVVMPPRGVQGSAIQPTWQGRTAPAPSDPGIAGYRFATPESKAALKPAQGPVVNTGYRPGQK